MHLIPRIFFL